MLFEGEEKCSSEKCFGWGLCWIFPVERSFFLFLCVAVGWPRGGAILKYVVDIID